MLALMQTAFHQRCQAALTHPITLGALGVLLLNDLVLKALWSSPWTTGKLSDLVWVVFASPLLAFLLSPVARNSRHAQRAVWVAAYVGLPLLYAAFNTFQPVHDAILRGLSLVSWGTAGSPFDPMDSLVIPLGLCLALWVWNRCGRPAGLRRQHIATVTAGLAALASIATSYPEPDDSGVYAFALTEQNTVVITLYGRSATAAVAASSGQNTDATVSSGLETSDGGFTWDRFDVSRTLLPFVSQPSVTTPRGSFAITGTGIARDGIEVYSTAYLHSDVSRWVQIQETDRRLKHQPVTTKAQSIIYDPQSGNVIVAMGRLGVVVGTPDGQWTPVAIGSWRPSVSSRYGRMQLLFGSANFWYVVALLPLATTGLVVASTFQLARRIADAAPPSDRAPVISVILSALAVSMGLFLLLTFGNFPEGTDLLYDIRRFGIAFIGCLLATVPFLILNDLRRQWRAAGAEPITWRRAGLTFLAMLALTVLPFVIWMQLNISLEFLYLSVAVLVILTGAAVLNYSLSKPRLTSTFEDAHLTDPDA